MNSNKIREIFLEFFREKNHQIVQSAPMVVKGDPTLMFTNAGMNQFKDIFLGNAPTQWPRAADSQKCLRVSGKHNDLDEVGHDTYHHTMFEMLGNWSFGDYFKKEAIDFAWELLIGRFGLPADRIYATIFEGSQEEGIDRDNEALETWKKYLPEDHILLGNKKDNFWEMGETGPCGPCSEIHFDLRDESERQQTPGSEMVNKGHHLVIEIWNLVFMQFNRKANGSLEPLPNRHVDTGMGFERLCMVLQNKKSNYDTDVFQPLIQRIAQMANKPYGVNQTDDVAMRVVADHLRAISFSIADGQLPSNVKAGYVIRRILRRAVRYSYTYLGFNEPFICKLVPTLVEQMGRQYPELKAQQTLIERVIYEEEASFLRTLSTGLNLLDGVMERCTNKTISGDDAFLLYDTYGFPIDLTELIAREHNLNVDIEGFTHNLEGQKARSRNAAAQQTDDWVELISITESQFVGYDSLECDAQIARYRKVTAKGKTTYQIVLDQTPFYGNSGGQVGDTGYLECEGERIEVIDTLKENGLIMPILKQLPKDVHSAVRAVVNPTSREASACNHSATHLMHYALREVLGSHVEQKGSQVTPQGLRFDFSHFQKVTPEQIRQVEHIVNRMIRKNLQLDEIRECPIEEASKMGAMMLFGEKYGTKVRVVKFGNSIEFCGGTHVAATGQIGMFKILSESAISAGVRRIEAITGEKCEEFFDKLGDTIVDIQTFLGNSAIIPTIKKMIETNESLNKQITEFKQAKINECIEELSKRIDPAAKEVIIAKQINLMPDVIKDITYGLRSKFRNIILVIGSQNEDKASLTIMLGDDIVARGANASKTIREAARLIEGGGGGQPFFATAGGKKPQGIEDAIIKARDLILESIK